MKTAASMLDLVGKTPILKLERYQNKYHIPADIFAKLEYFNPAGSVKDRVAKYMVEEAEQRGVLHTGSVIIEPTSGNTGIGLAAVGAVKGYRVIITMPETMSVERQRLIRAYGAEVVLTEGSKGMQGAIEKAQELAKEMPGSFLAGQFTNPANPKIHYLTTGPEIWMDMDGRIDAFVAGAGTGGTISGVGTFLKEKKPNVKIIAAEPEDSPVLSGGRAGAHTIQGIGAGFVPETLNTAIYDEVIKVPGTEAAAVRKALAQTEGILAGISSGAALWAAVQLAFRKEYAGKNIVVLLPDTGERYLSLDD